MQNELLNPSDIAHSLGVTTGRAYQLIGEGVIPHVRIGRRIRIPRTAWEEWLEEQNAQGRASVRKERAGEAAVV